ncbi:MAG: hypothetical protein F4W92_03030 [Gammaproteobacteria bacterium]|nr:hypothetical protein [Gammaproteobacteria bacterium]
MTENLSIGNTVGTGEPDEMRYFEPSFLNALPHYLPLLIFPLLILAAYYGGFWLLGPFVFMSVAGFLDRVFGVDGLNMNPRGISERRFIWYNIPVWAWAVLWPPTLVFGLWQICGGASYPIWQKVCLVMLLTMEAQAVFVVGHELVHRRSTWERRLGEFLLASNSYPQYATEHVYIHHAKVGTPHDVGSAPKGESFWRYFPREVVNNLTNSWQVTGERLARRKLSRWHYSNPFWRYGIALAFWYALVYYLGGIWAVPIYIFLGLSCVFSMKISNYFQHYGLRRVLMPNGRWEKISPRHSWNADWKFTNWMFFKMQRHADHHAMATRPYAQLQHRADESPELPGTYGDMMNLVLRPKRWFAKMDPLVDEWRKHFYPDIDDWSPYDSSVSAARPDDFNEIVEIFGVAPRLAERIERNPELLDNLSEREFTDLNLPKGILDEQEYDIARRGLARLYWTTEMGVQEMRDLIVEIPSTNSKETAEITRNWVNDKSFQIGMHVLRGNLSTDEASIALSNLAEATITTVISSTITDYFEQVTDDSDGGVAVILFDELATKEAFPGVKIRVLAVFDGWENDQVKRMSRSLRDRLGHLAADSLLFSPLQRKTEEVLALPFADLQEHFRRSDLETIPSLTRTRCVWEHGDTGLAGRFDSSRRELINECRMNKPQCLANASSSSKGDPHKSPYLGLSDKINQFEEVARFLQLTNRTTDLNDSAPTATTIFHQLGENELAEGTKLWRTLQGVARLVHEDSFDLGEAKPRVQQLIANSCRHDEFDALTSKLTEIDLNTTEAINAIVERA